MNMLHQLEYHKIIDLIIRHCGSEAGKELAREIAPMQDIEAIRNRLDYTFQVQQALTTFGVIDFSRLTDITDLLVDYPHQSYNFEEFKQLCDNIETTQALIDNSQEMNPDDYPTFYNELQSLMPLPDILMKFRQIYDAEGEILDSASPELRRIRKRKRQVRGTIQEKLQKFIASKASHLSDSFVTQRDNRYVIPVRESSAGMIEGLLHGRSSSRSTVFMEPAPVVQFNNELSSLDDDEKEEIFRILLSFSEDIRMYKDTLLKDMQTLIKLDMFYAIAQFSRRIDGHVPRIVEEPVLHLVKARHPLLICNLGDIRKVIPFDLDLGEDYRVLVISGPNTGGKTVTLKSAGLLSLMALSGLPVPADSESVIGLFDHVFADIGDDQSLENALSTFSSHIRRITEMMDNATNRTLILVDEIGAATDPEQGSALAQAILEELERRGSLCVITTHYTSIKVHAEQSESCRNAAMHFDPDKHVPTYRFKLGLPGNSFAIEVASSLGMDNGLVERARELTGKQNVELTELLVKMNHEKKELARQNYQSKLHNSLLQRKIDEYEKKLAEIEQETKEIKKRSIREARDYLIQFQKELQNEMDGIKKTDAGKRKKHVQEILKQADRMQADLSKEESGLVETKGSPLEKPVIGMEVWVRDFDAIGTITEISNRDIKVNVNGFFYTTKATNLFQVKKKAKPKVSSGVSVDAPGAKRATLELMLLGMTFDEALPMIEEFLDNAMMNGLNKVRIVHGKGTGALRAKVRQYLRRHKKVTDFFSPPPEAGGDGVTVVSFN